MISPRSTIIPSSDEFIGQDFCTASYLNSLFVPVKAQYIYWGLTPVCVCWGGVVLLEMTDALYIHTYTHTYIHPLLSFPKGAFQRQYGIMTLC